MAAASLPPDESGRLASLRSTGLLDTAAEERFDRLTRLAQRLFDVPIALVSLIDHDRQWFKSRQGLAVTETSRAQAFCAHAILGPEVFVVDDARADERFAENPLVVGDPRIRFYAGAPIRAPDGARLGTICVIDRKPRQLSPEDVATLADLAAMVEDEVAATYLATTDGLTGLANRRAFLNVGRTILELADRTRNAVACAYVDLDDMKLMNDLHGHSEGDRALVDVAHLLEQTFRQSDVIARLGGDEFAVLLSGTPEVGGETADRRLDAAVDADNRISGRPLPLRLSVGWAVRVAGSGESVAELLARADAVMYERKQLRKGGAGRQD